jgi:hypothetical protein
VSKINAAGSALVYSTYLGGGGVDQGLRITVDGSENGYVTGSTTSTNFPTANPLQAANGGYSDAFVTKVNAAGSALVYSTYLGGGGYDEGLGIAADGSGNVYVTGFTSSTNFPTANPLEPVNAGGAAFVAKITDTCPVIVSVSSIANATSMLETLYRFRDEVMVQSPAGKRYVELFYIHAEEATGILLNKPWLRLRVALMLWQHQPTFKTLIQRRPAALRSQDVKEIDGLIGMFMETASHAFSADLASLRQGLRDRTLLARFSIRVSD